MALRMSAIIVSLLAKNGFFTNYDEVIFLESDAGQKTIVSLHIDGIVDYLSK